MLLVNVPPVPKSAGWLVVHVSVLGGAGQVVPSLWQWMVLTARVACVGQL